MTKPLIIAANGTITIPKEICLQNNWLAGQEIRLEPSENGLYLHGKTQEAIALAYIKAPQAKVKDVIGMLKWHGEPLQIDDFDKSIEQLMAQNHEI